MQDLTEPERYGRGQRQADRIKTLSCFASGVAHELGTPLSVVAGRARLIASGELSKAEVQSSACVIQREADRMTAIIRQLLDFARCPPLRRAVVDLRHVVQQATIRLESLASSYDATIRVDSGGSPCLAQIDIGQIERVLTNLIVNAIQALPPGGRVDVRVIARPGLRPRVWPGVYPATRGQAEPGYVCVAVRDDGTGIAEQHRGHVFEPFFTTRSLGDGAGLGLSIADRIVQSHGGRIEIESTEGVGSCFSVYLPVGEPA